MPLHRRHALRIAHEAAVAAAATVPSRHIARTRDNVWACPAVDVTSVKAVTITAAKNAERMLASLG